MMMKDVLLSCSQNNCDDIYIYILVRTLLVGLVRKALINGFDIAWISMPSQQKKVVEEIECFHQ